MKTKALLLMCGFLLIGLTATAWGSDLAGGPGVAPLAPGHEHHQLCPQCQQRRHRYDDCWRVPSCQLPLLRLGAGVPALGIGFDFGFNARLPDLFDSRPMNWAPLRHHVCPPEELHSQWPRQRYYQDRHSSLGHSAFWSHSQPADRTTVRQVVNPRTGRVEYRVY